MDLTPFPSDFGTPENIEPMHEWDTVIVMEDKFSELFQRARDAYAKLPEAPAGFKWSLVTREDEPIYNRTDKELSMHFALVKEHVR